MPRYHFNILNDPLGPHEEGCTLPDLAAAKCEATKMAGALICDAAEDFWCSNELTLVATDSTGLTLFTLLILGQDAPAISSNSMLAI